MIDTDKRQSSFDFLSELGEEDMSTAHTEKEVKEVIAQAKKYGYDYVVIDTPPTITPLNAMIIRLSDKVLIAVKPARFDVKSVYNTIDLVKETKVKSCILLTQTINTSVNTKKNIEELQQPVVAYRYASLSKKP